MIDIVTLGDDVLREKAHPVTEFGPELAILVDAMFESMEAGNGIGLAGPQVAVPKRMFIVHIQGDEPRLFINPEIIETSQEIVSYEEGCLSIPGVFADVVRPAAVTMQAQDIHGKAFVVKADGMLARVLQHEYDHLNGILFIDRISEEKCDRLIRIYNRKKKKKHV
jgi:peptide deformylase